MENKEHNETFSANLILYRKRKNLTQAEVASALGISDKTYSKWETGETDPGISSVIKLAEFYGTSPAHFFDEYECSSTERVIDQLLDGLSPCRTIQKSFEIQFHAIRGLSKRAIDNTDYKGAMAIDLPENRVWPNKDHAITAFATTGVYEMMYNGIDANIVLSLMPNKEKYEWLRSEREMLSEYLSLIGDPDMLKCIPFMIDEKSTEKYTAEYLASAVKISTESVEALLDRCVKLEICMCRTAYIGETTVKLYSTMADQMIVGILTLAHLCLPTAEKNGCYYFNTPASQIMVEEEVF